MSASVARDELKLLRDTFRIVPLNAQMIHRAIDAVEYADFEDAIQFFSAHRAGAQRILTCNVRDFPTSTIPALSPREFPANAKA